MFLFNIHIMFSWDFHIKHQNTLRWKLVRLLKGMGTGTVIGLLDITLKTNTPMNNEEIVNKDMDTP